MLTTDTLYSLLSNCVHGDASYLHRGLYSSDFDSGETWIGLGDSRTRRREEQQSVEESKASKMSGFFPCFKPVLMKPDCDELKSASISTGGEKCCRLAPDFSPSFSKHLLLPHLWDGVHPVVPLHQLIFGGHAVLSFPHPCRRQCHTQGQVTATFRHVTPLPESIRCSLTN